MNKISDATLAPQVKYGWLCEWDRWIYGRHYTFRINGAWVVVLRWDKKDMWVESERWFRVFNAYGLFMRRFGVPHDLRYAREMAIARLQDQFFERAA